MESDLDLYAYPTCSIDRRCDISESHFIYKSEAGSISERNLYWLGNILPCVTTKEQLFLSFSYLFPVIVL